jgi:hypothetical protein
MLWLQDCPLNVCLLLTFFDNPKASRYQKNSKNFNYDKTLKDLHPTPIAPNIERETRANDTNASKFI